MVVITGDLVESPVESLVKAVEPLSQIKSTYGTYFSTGECMGKEFGLVEVFVRLSGLLEV